MAIWDIKERNDLVRANDNRTQKAVLFTDVSGKIKTFSMVSQSDSTDFGTMTSLRTCHGGTGSSSTTRGLVSGMETPGGNSDDIDYIEIAHNGNAADFGNLTAARGYAANVANNTRAITFGGGNSGMKDEIMFGTMANTGNFADFGDLTVARDQLAGTTSPTRAIFAGGSNGASPSSAAYNTIDFCTIASTGNAADFGDLTVARINGGMTGSQIRGTFAGGQNPEINVIDYITIANTGNATDFGDLTAARRQNGMVSNNVYGYAFGGSHSQTVIDRWLIASTGNATDWADLDENIGGSHGVSGSHGGIDLSTPGSQRPQVTALNRPGQTIGMFGGGYFGGTSTYLKNCEVIQVETLGTSSDYGDLTVAVTNSFTMVGNRTRGVRATGYSGGGSPNTTNSIDYCEFVSRGNFADFGDATAAHYGGNRGPGGNDVRSFKMGAYATPAALTIVDYWAPATLGNAADFGDLSVGATKGSGVATTTRVIRYGSYGVNTIDYHAIASLGDFSDFGDAVAAIGAGDAVSSPVRGVRVGAQGASNTMEYITMASTGNGTDFGDLTAGRNDLGAACSHTRGVMMGGSLSSGFSDTMDYITIASAGNATDFGDMSATRTEMGGMGNGHGGLA